MIQFIPYQGPRRMVLMEKETERTGATCANCGSELRYADYCYGLQEGVIGGTGFIATHLDDWLLFCSSGCVIDYLDHGEETRATEARLPPRMP